MAFEPLQGLNSKPQQDMTKKEVGLQGEFSILSSSLEASGNLRDVLTVFDTAFKSYNAKNNLKESVAYNDGFMIAASVALLMSKVIKRGGFLAKPQRSFFLQP